MKQKKQPYELVFKDRFLSSEPKENIYITVFLYFVVFLMSGILIFVSFVSMCQVKQTSMLPTLQEDDNVLILKANDDIKVGDVIVVTVDEGGKRNLIKRVIAVGGDSFIVKTDEADSQYCHIYLKKKGEADFSLLDESHIKEKMLTNKFSSKFFNTPYVVAEGMFFALGDNRNDSTDSRQYGSFPIEAVLGKMFFKIDKGSILEKLLILIYGTPS